MHCAVTFAALSTILLVSSHNSSYFDPSTNPNPKFGSWSEIKGPITTHFEEWLERSGYGADDFAQRFFHEFGSFGGKTNDYQKRLMGMQLNEGGNNMKPIREGDDGIKRTPIIFFHGNEDGALAVPGNYTSGSSSQIEYFMSVGYTPAELYVTTWGDRDSSKSMTNDHSCAMMQRLRRFLLAVLDYTQSRRANIISHSMGVTIARKIVKGGRIYEDEGEGCDLGEPLTDQIGAFIGLTGANLGMCACQGLSTVDKTCSPNNGFWPGDECGQNVFKCFSSHLKMPCKQENYSRLLWEMNHDGISEGQEVFSFWSVDDDLILNRAISWGEPTSFIPGSRPFVFQKMTHMETKENTTIQQHELLKPYETYLRIVRDEPILETQQQSPLILGIFTVLLIVILLLTAKLAYDKFSVGYRKLDYTEF